MKINTSLLGLSQIRMAYEAKNNIMPTERMRTLISRTLEWTTSLGFIILPECALLEPCGPDLVRYGHPDIGKQMISSAKRSLRPTKRYIIPNHNKEDLARKMKVTWGLSLPQG